LSALKDSEGITFTLEVLKKIILNNSLLWAMVALLLGKPLKKI
jgi:hypothetical protein